MQQSNQNNILKLRDLPNFYPKVNLSNVAMNSNAGITDISRQLKVSAAQQFPGNAQQQSQFMNAAYSPQFLQDILHQYNKMDSNNTPGENFEDKTKFIQQMGSVVFGRGETKAYQSPALRRGLMLKQPEMFGLQHKQPIPYDKMIAEKNRLHALTSGYAQTQQGKASQGAAFQLGQVLNDTGLLQEAYGSGSMNSGSIYDNQPFNKEVNLYKIRMRQERDSKLFSLQ